MPREVTDPDGIRWTCAQAYAGLGTTPKDDAAAAVPDSGGDVWVVCTPSGKAQSVRIELAAGWEEACSDEELLKAIGVARAASG